MKTLLTLALSVPLLAGFARESFEASPDRGRDNQPPVCCFGPDCQQTGLIDVIPCQGDETTYQLDASQSYDPDGDPLTFFWSSCPGSTIDDPTAPITLLRIDTSSSCSVGCGVRLFLGDGQTTTYCRLTIIIRPAPGDQGCSQGYWKNHVGSWGPTGFAPTDDFDTVFGVNAFSPDLTLLEALRNGGGGLDKLGRQATAALLNASHPDVDYPLDMTEVIDQVYDAITSGKYEPLATELDRRNNLGCPLN